MANNWNQLTLGDICTKIGSGATPRGGKEVYLPVGPYALIRSQNVHNDGFHRSGLAFITEEQAAELGNVAVKDHDVLLNITGDSVARACQVDPKILPARVNQHVAIVRPDPDKLDPRFLRYLLISPAMQERMLSWAGSGGTRSALTKSMIESFVLDAPEEIEEQRAVGSVLGALDDKIALNGRMIQTLESLARVIFVSWFVDFDPVHAKAKGLDPSIPKEIADLFPNSFDDSEVGPIPKGWRVGQFRDVVGVKRDQENPLSSPDSLFQHYSIPAYDEGQRPKPDFGQSIKSLKTRVPVGAVLLSKLNPEIERVWLVDVQPGERAVCSTEFLALVARPPFGRSYVYSLTRVPQFRQQVEGLVTGTSKSHQRAQVDSILNLRAVIPPPSLLAAFERTAGGPLARALQCRRESNTWSCPASVDG